MKLPCCRQQSQWCLHARKAENISFLGTFLDYIPCTSLSGVVCLNLCTSCMSPTQLPKHLSSLGTLFAGICFHARSTFSDVSPNHFLHVTLSEINYFCNETDKELLYIVMDLVCADPTQADSQAAGSTCTSNKDPAEHLQPWVLGDKWQPSCLPSIPTPYNWINYRPKILHVVLEIQNRRFMKLDTGHHNPHGNANLRNVG